jgi:hypothetical protein
MNIFDLSSTKKPKLSKLKDPFALKHVELVEFSWSKWYKEWRGRVRFKNGNTEGTQRFAADSFTTITLEIEQFISTL